MIRFANFEIRDIKSNNSMQYFLAIEAFKLEIGYAGDMIRQSNKSLLRHRVTAMSHYHTTSEC